MTDLIADHQKWLKQAVAVSGLSPSALAKKARVAQTTVTRLYYNRPPLHALNAHSLRAIEKASGCAYSGGKTAIVGFFEGEAARFEAADENPVARMIAAVTSGLNGVDPWVMRSRALEGANIAPGDVMIVDMNAQPARGDIVCAQIGDWERGETVETVFRLYEPPYLLAQTSVPDLRAPTLVDGVKATIRGVAVAVVRPRLGRVAA